MQEEFAHDSAKRAGTSPAKGSFLLFLPDGPRAPPRCLLVLCGGPETESRCPQRERRTPRPVWTAERLQRSLDTLFDGESHRRARQPRALQARSRRRRQHRRQAVGQRARDGVGTARAGLLRRMGGTWRRNRRPRGRRSAGRAGCATRQSSVSAPAGLARTTRSSRATTSGLRMKGSGPCATGRTCNLCSGPATSHLSRGECAIRRGRLRRGEQRLAAGPRAGLSLRARAAASFTNASRSARSSRSGTFRGRIRATSRSARGDASC